ncbi:MAG: hypothetical protein M1840_005184 [Geoglossum simile]|nr:MAG: hypothetical protein M1840_005184 [Geoglossum simile]
MATTRKILIAFFLPILMLDCLVAIWQFLFIAPILYPLEHQDLVDNRVGWTALTVVGWIISPTVALINTIYSAEVWIVMVPKPVRGRGFVRLLLLNVGYIALSVFVAGACLLAPLIAVPVAWEGNFRHSCRGFDHRVSLDVNSVYFRNLLTSNVFTMTFSPNPRERHSQTYAFYVDPVSWPPANRSDPGFFPSYDSITYNFSTRTYDIMFNSTSLLTGSFSFSPSLSVPDLDISADVSTFIKRAEYHPFLKIYDSAGGRDVHDRRRKWEDNADVMMRTAKFSHDGPLFLCVRAEDADVKGLGELSPVVAGLVVLLRELS